MLDMYVKGRCGINVPTGQDHHNAKLTRNDVEEIRRRYAAGGTTQQRLGDEFGIDQTHVGRIVRLEMWK